MNEDEIQRFLLKVKITPNCWWWEAGQRGNGYGCFKLNGKVVSAHRISYEIEYGKIPEGLVIHNICGNRNCVSPHHLQAITYRENTAEAIKRGVHMDITQVDRARGEQVGVSKLNEAQVKRIRSLYATGCTSERKLANQFYVSRESIRSVLKRKTWKHVQ